MIRLAILSILIALSMQGSAAASFLPPDCHPLSEAEREREADIIGVARVTDVICSCSQGAPCITYLRFTSPEKGDPGTTPVRITESLNLDFGVNEKFCRQREESARAVIGTSQTYYLSNRNGEYTPVPTQRCE